MLSYDLLGNTPGGISASISMQFFRTGGRTDGLQGY